MTWMRRTKQWTRAVMAWWALSWLVANAAPLMTEGGALVCSASGSKWVTLSNAMAGSGQADPVSHTWHCSLCLPFVAVSSAPPFWAAMATPADPLPQVFGHTWQAPAWPPYGARAPPLFLNA